ncbi:SulP family inorganic anion transporter [Candidatus Entotheonella palauensis]|uniref:SulP family inorganic anion transporter n=1 Tax=Candidatus Entotheonella palauensis TaxID=93172 RepID=UPI0015C43796|nr:SulP family inorganic anion transporter [Candidatus Entotheonella palauensis]
MERSTQPNKTKALAIHPSDFLAGLSVALLAIPQAMAYAGLAGMPAYTGLYVAAIPPIAAAYFASSPYLQTGPVALTALLTFAVLSQLAHPGTAEYIGLAALLALMVGVARLAVGLIRLGSVAYLMSQPMLIGFTSAAAILICFSQLSTVLGVQPPIDGVLPGSVWTLTHPSFWEWGSLILSLLTVALIQLGRRLHPLFPGVLIAVGIGVAYSHWWDYSGPILGDVPTGFPSLHWDFPWASLPALLIGAGVIAILGFAEPASIARTYATQDRIPWDANQEFVGQGVANLAAAFAGGFPVGGSFSRSAANRLAGAKTRWSGAITGIVVLFFLPFTTVLRDLPQAVLGAIVIATVMNLVRPRQLLGLLKYSRPQAAIGLLTFMLTLVLAPRIEIAVIIGVALAVAHHLRREQKLVFDHWTDAGGLHFKPQGVLWFGSAYTVEAEFAELLAKHPEVTDVKLHLGGLGRIDLSAAIMFKQLMEDAKTAGMKVELLDVPPMAKSWVDRVWQEELEA